MKGYIARRVPDKADREDILQDVFYQLLKTDPVATPIQQVSGWLYAVARNLIIDKSQKHKEEEMPYPVTDDGDVLLLKEVSEYLFDTENSPEKEYIRSLVWKEPDSALSELPEEQRIVFDLTKLQGFSFKEISESTGIAVNTHISRKKYAVLYLRKSLCDLYKELLRD